MKLINPFLAVAVTISMLGLSVSAQADTVNARCDVYPAGEDRATSSGLCTFSQRQGAVSIQLQNGESHDLDPVGNQPGTYLDQDGRAAYRQAGLGSKGQIYRFADESIYVYWDPSPYGQNSGSSPNSTNAAAAASSAPEVGTTVSALSDLVGARAGQAENAIRQRGYRFVKADPSGDAVYSYWLEAKTNYCVTIRTAQGRYESIVYTGGSADCQK